jgi:CRISPR-associated endonuclease/helicase Cas3
MDYPVKASFAQRDDTLLQMLGENSMAVEDARIAGVTRSGLMQSFYTAAQAFRAIDCQTQGVVVPFRKDGIDLIAELSAAHDLASEFRLLRKAQQFTVNVFPHEMERLRQKGAVHEAQPGTGVLCLREGFYSDEFGLALDGSERMESLIA